MWPANSFFWWDGTVYWRLVGKVGDPPSPTIAPFAVGTPEAPVTLQTGVFGVGWAILEAIAQNNQSQASLQVNADETGPQASLFVGGPGPRLDVQSQAYLWGSGVATNGTQAVVYNGKALLERRAFSYQTGEAQSTEQATVPYGSAQITSEANVDSPSDGADGVWRIQSVGGQITGGSLYLGLNGQNSVNIPWDADAALAQAQLGYFEPSIGVTGGPLNVAPLEIRFPKKATVLSMWTTSLEGDDCIVELLQEQVGYPDAFASNRLSAQVSGQSAVVELTATKDTSWLGVGVAHFGVEANSIELWANTLTFNGLPIGASASHWEPLVIGSGPMPTAFPDPASATAEDVATAINALLAAPQLVYADGDVVMVEVF
jgi:hypothetical protein